ncbi:MAG: hypothetical protein Q9211_005467, partial [Gyalolechia sp. 1 TL-2023]
MLRVLESFKGILIMTTNRVMTVDVATLSRCHYAVTFRSLTLHQEQQIWQDYVRQLTDQNSSGKKDIEDWVRQITKKRTKLSGREIRNVFTRAKSSGNIWNAFTIDGWSFPRRWRRIRLRRRRCSMP